MVEREPAPTRNGRAGPAPPVPPDVLGPVLRVVVLTAGMSGLRRSELLGLRWRDVDWEAQRIRVRNAYVLGEHSAEGKSDLSTRRSVPMADRLMRELDAWSQRTAFNDDDDLVFAHPETGNALDGAKVSKRFKAACRAAKVRDRPLPRPAPHLRDAPRGGRDTAADDPGVPRARGRQDDPDLLPLRALRTGGGDRQRRLRGKGDGVQFGVQFERN